MICNSHGISLHVTTGMTCYIPHVTTGMTCHILRVTPAVTCCTPQHVTPDTSLRVTPAMTCYTPNHVTLCIAQLVDSNSILFYPDVSLLFSASIH